MTLGERYLLILRGAVHERDGCDVRRQRAENARVDMNVEGLHLQVCKPHEKDEE